MFQFIPLLLLQCVYLLRGENAGAAGSSVIRGVIMCKRWCESRNWCSEATCNVSIECTGSDTPLSAGRTGIPIPQHLCETCQQHHVCLRSRTGATKCVRNGSRTETEEGKTTPDGKTTGLVAICKGDAGSCVQTLRHGRSSKKMDCNGGKLYVDLRMRYVTINVVYYYVFAKCKNEKRLTSDVAFDEPKIYYWMMTTIRNRIGSRENTKSFSFQLAVTNLNRVAPDHLKQAKVFKGFTITVGKHITFKSLKVETHKLRRRGRHRFAVVLDKINGRMFLGTRTYCLAAQDSIDVRFKLYPVVVHSSRSATGTNRNRIWFHGMKRKKFSAEDVGNLLHRCEHDFAL